MLKNISSFKSVQATKIKKPSKEQTKYDRVPPADPHKPGPGFYNLNATSLYESMKNLSKRHS